MEKPIAPLTQTPDGEQIETTQAEGTRDPGETEEKVGRTGGQAEGERPHAPQDDPIDGGVEDVNPDNIEEGDLEDEDTDATMDLGQNAPIYLVSMGMPPTAAEYQSFRRCAAPSA
jgi:hypothetical protein